VVYLRVDDITAPIKNDPTPAQKKEYLDAAEKTDDLPF